LSKGKTRPRLVMCARCGILRKASRPQVVLCTDCRYVLSEAERQMWNEKTAAA
jgi:ribosomal protein L37E